MVDRRNTFIFGNTSEKAEIKFHIAEPSLLIKLLQKVVGLTGFYSEVSK